MAMQNCNQYKNQPQEEEDEGTDERWAVMGTGTDGDREENKIIMNHLQHE